MSKIVCSGALFYALDTKRFLFLHRANGKTSGTWGLVGGGNELDESPFEGLTREIQEEVGDLPKFVKTIPLETFVSNDEKFNFHTYLVVIKKEFLPNLNNEHDGYAWTSFGKWPKTLHQGLRNTLQNKTNLTKLQTVFQVIDLLEE
jgi:8-oxo-dGTP pyrophosphatase MutT (NUDIX family)|tara:strand:- start:3034 stop:3471 length:438 start_codon:yes stop_codon:yes gene_type:complete